MMRRILFICCFMAALVLSTKAHAFRDEVRYIETSDSCRLYVHVKGEGPMCLYLHGGPGSGSAWMETLVGPVLEKRFTMVYLDQRGVCKSETPASNDFSFDRQIRDWEEVRAALEVEDWMLMGHSWGGILMMGYWQKHPQAIDGMLFLNCTLSCGTSMEDSWLPTAIDILGDQTSPVAKDVTRPLKERLMAVFPQLDDDNRWRIFSPDRSAYKVLDSPDFHKDCISHNGEHVLFMDEYWQDFRPLTSNVNVPVLFLFGTQDFSVGPEFYTGVHFPNAVVCGAECGHMIFIEEPTLFENCLDDYLELYFNAPH